MPSRCPNSRLIVANIMSRSVRLLTSARTARLPAPSVSRAACSDPSFKPQLRQGDSRQFHNVEPRVAGSAFGVQRRHQMARATGDFICRIQVHSRPSAGSAGVPLRSWGRPPSERHFHEESITERSSSLTFRRWRAPLASGPICKSWACRVSKAFGRFLRPLDGK